MNRTLGRTDISAFFKNKLKKKSSIGSFSRTTGLNSVVDRQSNVKSLASLTHSHQNTASIASYLAKRNALQD